MTVIPCEQGPRLRAEIERFAEVLKTQAHKLGSHGLEESSFYSSPIFRGAIEKVRGEVSASMRGKREFVQHVLNYREDAGFIAGWDRTRPKARNDYYVQLNSGGLAVIDLKGCLDGENTNKFERPTEADEFITWSLCTNSGADPCRNAWSGIHTRLSAEMISRNKRVDGVVISRRRGPEDLPRALPHPSGLHLCLSSRNSLSGKSAVYGASPERSSCWRHSKKPLAVATRRSTTSTSR